jgi:cellulose biosynthesis protein BcsQ
VWKRDGRKRVKIVALYSIKGGVGKTAAAVNLAYAASRDGMRTLIVDLDHQGASSFYFRVRPRRKFDGEALLKGGKQVDRSVRATDFEGLDILPADRSFRTLDLALDALKKSRTRLARKLRPTWRDYDVVVLDCPPALNLTAENVFRAADVVLTPLIPTTLSVRSDEMLREFFADHELDRAKIVAFFSMVDRRKKLHREVVEEFAAGDQRVFATAIPYASDVERMGVHREPVECFAPSSAAAEAYRSLWADLRRFLRPDAS